MAGVTAALLGGAAASAIGGALANDAANKGLDAAQRQYQNALDQYNNIKAPTYEELKVMLQNPQLMGEVTPEMEQALALGPSAQENVQAPAEVKAQQMQALKELAELGKGGLSEGDKAAYREMQRMNAQDAQAQQNSILSNMAQRGVLGSGAELAARLQASQNSQNNMSKGSDSLMRDAQARALQALSQSGSLAGQVRSQDVNEQENIARAKDAIAQFNLQNQQNVGNANTSLKNQAQLQNLQNRQNLENIRASNSNQQSLYNSQQRNQMFNNAMGLAGAKSGQYQQQGQLAATRGANNARAIGTAFNGISSGLGSMAGMGKPQAAGFQADPELTAQLNDDNMNLYNTKKVTG